MNDST